MNTIATSTPPALPADGAGKTIALALSLAEAERAIQAFTSGQVDAIFDADGKAYLLRGAQEQLRQSERQLRTIIDSCADAIVVVSDTGLILSHAGAVRGVLGFNPDDLVGRDIFELVHKEDVSQVYAAFFNVQGGFLANTTVAFRHLTSDRSYRPIEASVGKLRDVAEGGIVLTCRNATVRMRAQEETLLRETALIEASRTKDRFIAMLSHELRTPLSPVLLAVEELQEDERFLEARPALTVIRRNVDLQVRLLEELFDFTKVGQHKVRLRLEAIDVHEAIGFVLKICKADIATAKIDVRLILHATAKTTLADSARLQQVMWNLIKNAVKFSTPGGCVSITSANDQEGNILLHFIDNGLGIEPGLLPHIFDPFRQGEHAASHRSSGLGLGLFIAKGMVEAQDGSLSVTSKGVGKGADFCVTLKSIPIAGEIGVASRAEAIL